MCVFFFFSENSLFQSVIYLKIKEILLYETKLKKKGGRKKPSMCQNDATAGSQKGNCSTYISSY